MLYKACTECVPAGELPSQPGSIARADLCQEFGINAPLGNKHGLAELSRQPAIPETREVEIFAAIIDRRGATVVRCPNGRDSRRARSGPAASFIGASEAHLVDEGK
jgi:hypothetical protein